MHPLLHMGSQFGFYSFIKPFEVLPTLPHVVVCPKGWGLALQICFCAFFKASYMYIALQNHVSLTCCILIAVGDDQAHVHLMDQQHNV